MRKIKNKIILLLVTVLILFSYAVPEIVTVYEDRHLQSSVQAFEIEKISLNSNTVDIKEELEIFRKLLEGSVIIQQSEVEEDSELEYKIAKENVLEFLGFLDGENVPEFQEFSLSSLVLADISIEKVYPLWKCYAVDENGEGYILWLDEITGKIIAFDLPTYKITMDEEKCEAFFEQLKEYYGFPDCDWTGAESMWEYDYAWGGEILFYNEAGVRDVAAAVLPFWRNEDRIYMNMYGSNVESYVVTDMSAEY